MTRKTTGIVLFFAGCAGIIITGALLARFFVTGDFADIPFIDAIFGLTGIPAPEVSDPYSSFAYLMIVAGSGIALTAVIYGGTFVISMLLALIGSFLWLKETK